MFHFITYECIIIIFVGTWWCSIIISWWDLLVISVRHYIFRMLKKQVYQIAQEAKAVLHLVHTRLVTKGDFTALSEFVAIPREGRTSSREHAIYIMYYFKRSSCRTHICNTTYNLEHCICAGTLTNSRRRWNPNQVLSILDFTAEPNEQLQKIFWLYMRHLWLTLSWLTLADTAFIDTPL